MTLPQPGTSVQWTDRQGRTRTGTVAEQDPEHMLSAMGKVFLYETEDGRVIPHWINSVDLTPVAE
jgi:hypothetical protein